MPECLVFTRIERGLRYNFCRAGRGEVDLSKLSFDPIWRLPLYDGKSCDDGDGGDVIRSFRFFKYGVEQKVDYSFIDKPLSAEQQEEEEGLMPN